MKTKTFKTVKELLKFLKEFEEKWSENDLYLDKTVDINYFKLTVTLRKKQENRKVENESTTYFYRDIGANDSLQLMRHTEKSQYPSDTKWMTKIPITITKERK
jgi:cystathionine beta-lyase family protein involved in aluminum resistance